MAAITSAGNGNWSSAGTWSGGVPANGDTVTIQAGHTVTFDVDQSAFASGLAGLTINGTLEASTATGSYYLKMAGNITASISGGILRAGSSGTPYPSDCLFTVFLNGNYQINCHASNYLTLELYCYDPPIKYAKLISATPKAITSITLGSTTTIGCTGHGYSVGNTVWLQDIGGTTELNDQFFEVATVPTADSFTIRWPDPDTAVDSTDYTAWTSGGIVCPQTAEASGQTQIEIDEDVSADVEWNRAGAIVRIDNINRTNQSEAYTISGTASTYLTLSSGLSNAKYSGSLAILVTRNVRINSSATAIGNGMIRYGSGHVLRCEIRSGSTSTDGVREGTGHTISGPVSGCSSGVLNGSGFTISGPVSGCGNGVYLGSGHTIGPVSGCGNGVLSGSGFTISGPVSGCGNGVYLGSGHTISGPVSGCGSGVLSGSGFTISGPVSGCGNGVYLGSGHTISGPVSGCGYGTRDGSGFTISGPVSGCDRGINGGSGYKFLAAEFTANTNDIYRVPDFYAVDTLFGSATEFSGYLEFDRGITAFAESINHDQTPNAYRAWCRGGYVEDNASTKYTGRDRSYEHICESADYYVFRNYSVTIPQGGGLVIECYVQKDASMSYLPRVWILEPGEEPFISGSPTQAATMTDSVDTWETLTLVYANSTGGDTTVTVRTVAKNASGSVFFDPIITVLAPATYDVYGTLLGYVDNLEERLTADRASKLDYLDATISSRLATAGYTAPLDAAGTRSAVGLASANLDTQLGDLPTAAENRAEMDSNSTKLDVAVSTRLASAGYTAPLDAAGVRSAVGLASANLDTQIDDLPTAAENRAEMDSNSTQLAAILVDTGVDIPALIVALNNLSQADVRSAVGLASANLDTQLGDLPTAAENRVEMDSNSTKLDVAVSTRLATAGYTAPLDAAGVRSAVGLASANLDTQIDGLPTAAEIVAALMAKIMSGSKTYEQAFLDLWAIVVGDSAADDGDEPASITYDSPDGTVQRTHAITETTRTVS